LIHYELISFAPIFVLSSLAVTITSSGGLSETDIQNMVKQAEQHAAEDKQKKEAIEAKNDAESLLYSSERSLSESKDKLSKEDVQIIEQAMNELRESLTSNNGEVIREKKNNLSTKMGEVLYKVSSLLTLHFFSFLSSLSR
jgi:molecular chaperone DnaK